MNIDSESIRRSVSVLHPSRLTPGLACVAAAIALSATVAIAQAPTQGAREVPAKTVPVPDTVSPQMQKLIAAPLTPTWNVIPKTAEEWKAQVNAGAT